MSAGFTSPHWHRVAKLRPRLHDQVRIHRHDYRGQIWYLLENATSGRSHRFNPAAYQFIGALDGQRSVQDIFDRMGEKLAENTPGQEEIIELMSKLYQADLLKSGALAEYRGTVSNARPSKERRISSNALPTRSHCVFQCGTRKIF